MNEYEIPVKEMLSIVSHVWCILVILSYVWEDLPLGRIAQDGIAYTSEEYSSCHLPLSYAICLATIS